LVVNWRKEGAQSVNEEDMDAQSVNEEDDLQAFSIDETARRLDMSAYTIREWVGDRKIASIKIGKRRLVPKDEIRRIFAEGRVERKSA